MCKMSDLQLQVSEASEQICDKLCKYCDNDYIRNGGKSCQEYCSEMPNEDCELRKLLKAVGIC